MNDGCPHWPEVEAADDGRFGVRDRERVARHLAGCAACRTRRARALALQTRAREGADAAVSALEHRRARVALLRAAMHEREPRGATARRAMAFALPALAAAVAMVVLRRAPHPRGLREAVEARETRVVPVGSARWTRRASAGQETVALYEGTLAVSVAHQRRGHRFVVALPDGELEVRGTRFTVSVRGGHTERVEVSEGLVALRVERGSEQLVAAGGRWQAPALCVTAPPAEPSPAPARTPPPDASSTLAAATAARSEATARAAAATPTRATPVANPRPAPAADHAAMEGDGGGFQHFADGVAAMGRGDHRVAAAHFADFEASAPHDERADDAGWLRVVALRRARLDAEATEAAAVYLQRHPRGAHRGTCASLVARAAWLRGDCARVLSLAHSDGSLPGASDLALLADHCARDGGAP